MRLGKAQREYMFLGGRHHTKAVQGAITSIYYDMTLLDLVLAKKDKYRRKWFPTKEEIAQDERDASMSEATDRMNELVDIANDEYKSVEGDELKELILGNTRDDRLAEQDKLDMADIMHEVK